MNKILSQIKRLGLWLTDHLGPKRRGRWYCGFKLYYNRGNGLVRRLNREPIFEPELGQAIVAELSQANDQNSRFLDIGANIGLISLYVLAKRPKTIIDAFEPGWWPQQLLAKTVEANRLAGLNIHAEALADRTGLADFYRHDPKQAALDGLRDTKRRGQTTAIQVAVNTLDNWWRGASRPAVAVIKIDTEGAELLVLKGGEEFIGQTKPTIFLEIEPLNLRVYDYNELDILSWFTDHYYTLHTLDGVAVNKENLSQLLLAEDTYVAKPLVDQK